MRYVILRDDDTNALTPVECLERLYRPFLDRGLPINLATIPNVRTDVTYGDGVPEGFLVAKNGELERFRPIGSNRELVEYLQANSCFHIIQHGCRHEFVNGDCEFEQHDTLELARRLEEGAAWLRCAGFASPETFIAPYDRFTPASFREVARRFRVISTGWFEWRRLPVSWWPQFFSKKLFRRAHWKAGGTILLSHPGCHLSYHRDRQTMLEKIKSSIDQRRLTVVVTHWWEFFRGNQPDDAFIRVLHGMADYLATARDVKVVTFRDVAEGKAPID